MKSETELKLSISTDLTTSNGSKKRKKMRVSELPPPPAPPLTPLIKQQCNLNEKRKRRKMRVSELTPPPAPLIQRQCNLNEKKKRRKMRVSELPPTPTPPPPTPPQPPRTPLIKQQCNLNEKKKRKKWQAKFRPKVMDNSPSSSSSRGGRKGLDHTSGQDVKRPSCKRVLDFDSGYIETKTMKIYTKEGFCFTRKVNKFIQANQQKSLEPNEKDVEEWWKNEREIFRVRALSFIASMRLVQGNRTFMGWKGSVVDSVVGVFLTQNTADNMSSSAFMCLAAKYPKENLIKDPKNVNHTEHTIDWNAVRCAQLDEISDAIQDRGMNNRIAERIMKFLDSIHDTKTGLLDLEWLRNAKPGKAIDFFMGIYGLGIKSMACLQLLTLSQNAFPVDRHVSRIVVRLGWVPIEKLPVGVPFHELKEYPAMESVQEYLSPRLSNLDVETLYELHYQMITFGKVFCRKKKPNCNSCPLKNSCKYYASANPRYLDSDPPVENTFVPVTPGPNEYKAALSVSCPKVGLDQDIEDLVAVPKVHINKTEELLKIVWNYMSENGIPLIKDDVSKALITVSAEKKVFAPVVRKLKNAGRMRTEHQVFELPDSHPLMHLLDKRDSDDKHPYLLAIWPPVGEKDHSILLKEDCCSLQSTEPNKGDLPEEETVYGTLLVPCRTATRGSFPLDGTFFQINEVFADDESSQNPLVVPKKLLRDLTTKTLFCGTSISAIFEGLSSQEIRSCFFKGYVCIRGFSMKTRAPRPLHELFHCGVSKTVKINRKRTKLIK